MLFFTFRLNRIINSFYTRIWCESLTRVYCARTYNLPIHFYQSVSRPESNHDMSPPPPSSFLLQMKCLRINCAVASFLAVTTKFCVIRLTGHANKSAFVRRYIVFLPLAKFTLLQVSTKQRLGSRSLLVVCRLILRYTSG